MWNCDERYEADAKRFISNAVAMGNPFFYYYASHHTHMPQFAPKSLQGKTMRGPFGDSLLTLDRTLGRLTDHLAAESIEDNTLVW